MTFTQDGRLCLLAHARDGWLIATAMRLNAGLGQSMAHTEVSTGELTQDVAFHDEFDGRQWLFIDHESVGKRNADRPAPLPSQP